MNAVPLWIRPLIDERITLIANHLLSSEPVAIERFRQHAGRGVAVTFKSRWPVLGLGDAGSGLRWRVTPAGMLELASADEIATTESAESAGLTVEVDLIDPWAVMQRMLSGQRPGMSIQGDAAFAADVAWVIDHLRWDAQDDLARVVGDLPAHLVAQWLQRIKAALLSVAGAVKP